MISTEIITRARENLINIIQDNIIVLYHKNNNGENPNFEDDEEWVVDKSEVKGLPKIRLEVDDSYLDVYDRIYEEREIEEVRMCADFGVLVRCGDDNDEVMGYELSTDELYEIAKALETATNNV